MAENSEQNQTWIARKLVWCHAIMNWKWTDLRRVGSQPIARKMYYWVVTIPLVAKVLGQLEPSYSLVVFGTKLTIVLQLPFSWTMFYFGSVFIALATLLFSLKCPALISRYKNSREFIDAVNSEFILRNEAIDASIRQKNEHILVSFANWFCQRDDALSQINAESMLVHHRIRIDQFADAFYYLRMTVNLEMPRVRWIIAAFYFVGFGCFAVVFTEAFWSVVRIVLR